MVKLVMPKHSADLEEIKSVLKIYFEAEDWLTNDEYKVNLKELIGENQYSSSYTKKAQITSYFGFTISQELHNSRSDKKITDSGKRMYTALRNKNIDQIHEILITSLETITFGRNNHGVRDSESDIEPPSVFIRAILDLDYLTYNEFAYLLWKLEDIGGNFTDTIDEIRQSREDNEEIEIGEEAKKYLDAKPILILKRWGILTEYDGEIRRKQLIIEPLVLEKYKKRLKNLKIYNVDKNNEEVEVNTDSIGRKIGGDNILLYGVPGSGKSFKVEDEYIDDVSRMERLVFHPDYMNTEFIGQILPSIHEEVDDENKKSISYKFSPGPFTKLLKRAIHDPGNFYYLVIEELNRGNAPAIFGEVFQLLDRDNVGNSEYKISNEYIADTVYGDMDKLVYLPSNLIIIATMNTADQNVFTLDTAFQRRWNMRMVHNNIEDAEHGTTKILDTDVTWSQFNIVINNLITLYSSENLVSEDKRLGAYFITKNDLLSDDSSNDEYTIFGDKLIKYLWDDAFKFNRDQLFDSKYKNLEDVLVNFSSKRSNERFKIFDENIFRELLNIETDEED